MARQHLSIPDDVLSEVDDWCKRFSMARSKFIVSGIRMALDDMQRRYGDLKAASDNATAAVNKLTSSLNKVAPVVQDEFKAGEPVVVTLRRGDTTWFSALDVCEALGIEYDALLAEIDPNDDILDYQGKPWIDERGLAEARTLCSDPEVADALTAWARTKLIS